MSASLFKFNFEGDGPINATATVPVGYSYRLISVSCRWNAAPTTSEFFTITADLNAGAVFDVLLYTVDPSVASTYSIVFLPDQEEMFEGGDAIDVSYAGTDPRHWGLQITMKAV
jgi:hypothetical protein